MYVLVSLFSFIYENIVPIFSISVFLQKTFAQLIEKTVPEKRTKKSPPPNPERGHPKNRFKYFLLENGSCESHTIQSPYL